MTWTTRPRSEGAGSLSYWRSGNGPPLVLIHGVGLQAEAWSAIAPVLAQHFTVFAVDMPGHGHSPLEAASGLSDYTERFLAFAEAQAEPVAVAGHSMGAMIALDMAVQAPDRVQSVAALNAIYRRTAEAAAAVQARAAGLTASRIADPGGTLMRWFGPSPIGSDVSAAAACRVWLTDVSPAGYAAAYSVFSHFDGPDDDVLRALVPNALFQTGAHDPNSTPQMSQAMAGLAPHGQAVIVEDAAHMMPMTHPSAVSNALLSTFRNKEGIV